MCWWWWNAGLLSGFREKKFVWNWCVSSSDKLIHKQETRYVISLINVVIFLARIHNIVVSIINILSHSHSFTACAPVLLPSRVVQALKINVQSIGVQISTRQGWWKHRVFQLDGGHIFKDRKLKFYFCRKKKDKGAFIKL